MTKNRTIIFCIVALIIIISLVVLVGSIRNKLAELIPINSYYAWYIMSYKDAHVNKSISLQEPGLGVEIAEIINAILPTLCTNGRYRAALRRDVPERFHKVEHLKGTVTIINNHEQVQLESTSEEYLRSKYLVRAKFKFYNDHGQIKYTMVKDSEQNFYPFRFQMLINKSVALKKGSKISRDWGWGPFKRNNSYLIYHFTNGIVGYYDISKGYYYELNKKEDWCYTMDSNFLVTYGDYESRKKNIFE